MVYIGLFHPCEHRANISDKDQGIELAFSIALADPNFLTTQRLSAFAQCPQLPEASRRSTGVNASTSLPMLLYLSYPNSGRFALKSPAIIVLVFASFMSGRPEFVPGGQYILWMVNFVLDFVQIVVFCQSISLLVRFSVFPVMSFLINVMMP